MQINYLRASTINTYSDCPWKFFLLYVIGFTSTPNKKAMLGTIVHHVLEILAKAKKIGYSKLYERKLTNPQYLLDICWDRYKNNYGHLFEMNSEDYQFCEKQILYVLSSPFNPLNLKILDTEKQFDITIAKPHFEYDYNNYINGDYESGYLSLRGTIDLITEVDEDTIEIIDYKTGLQKDWITGKEKEFEDFYKDIQLRMYDIATNTIYSKYKNRLLTIIYTQTESPFTITFSTKDYQISLDTLRRFYNDISKDNTFKRLKDNKARFRTEAFKCHYVCQFGKITHDYQSDDGDIITETFKYIQPRSKHLYDYPEFIIHNDKTYYRITQENNSVCDKYYKLFRSSGQKSGSQQLYQIALDQNLQEKVSRRNDYNRSGIFKGTIK